MPEPQRDLAFISYHHRDRAWLDRLEVHLKPLSQQGALIYWSDAQVQAGRDLQVEIECALSRASVLVLLVSADYLASPELERMLKAAQAYRAAVVWLPVRASNYQITALSGIVPLTAGDRPLALLTEEEVEAELVCICQRIALAVKQASGFKGLALPPNAELGFAPDNRVLSFKKTSVVQRKRGELFLRHPAAWLGCVGVTLVILAIGALRYVQRKTSDVSTAAPIVRSVVTPPLLTSDPSDAEVICDRVLIGKTPLPLNLIPATAQDVCLRAEDRADQVVKLIRGQLGFAPLHVQLTMRATAYGTVSPLPCRIPRGATLLQDERPDLRK